MAFIRRDLKLGDLTIKWLDLFPKCSKSFPTAICSKVVKDTLKLFDFIDWSADCRNFYLSFKGQAISIKKKTHPLSCGISFCLDTVDIINWLGMLHILPINPLLNLTNFLSESWSILITLPRIRKRTKKIFLLMQTPKTKKTAFYVQKKLHTFLIKLTKFIIKIALCILKCYCILQGAMIFTTTVLILSTTKYISGIIYKKQKQQIKKIYIPTSFLSVFYKKIIKLQKV